MHNNAVIHNQQPLLKTDPQQERIDVAWPPAESTPTKWSPVDDFAQFKEGWREATLRSRKQRANWTWVDYAGTVLPCINWLRNYNWKEWILFDLFAGLAVGFTVVPQSLSYAGIAGMPAVFGLYGAFLPVLTYALFGTCRQLGVGPVAVTSGLIGSGLANTIPGYSSIANINAPTGDEQAIVNDYTRTVVSLAFLVACMYTAIGVLRLGFIIRFLSHPVITGFTTGAAFTIGSSQVKYIFGVSYPRQNTVQGEWSNLAAQCSAGNFQWQEFVMGGSIMLFLIATRVIAAKWPKAVYLKALGPFFACVIGILTIVIGKWTSGKGPIKIVKNIPAGLPPVTVTQWAPIPYAGTVVPLAIIVVCVDLLESTSIARALARKNGYELKYNQEIVALGLANFVGAFFSSYSTTGSFSRSAISNSSGAKSQIFGFITAIIVMFVLLFLTPVFRLMPYNTMAAIIIVGVSALVEFGVAYELLRVHFRDFIVWMVAFLVTCFAGVDIGLAASIGLSVVITIAESAFPHITALGRVQKTTVFRSVENYPDSQQTPGVVIVRPDAPLYFANIIHFEERVQRIIEDGDEFAQEHGVGRVRFVVLDMNAVHRIDSMGANSVKDLARELKERKGIQLLLSNPNPKVARILERSRISQALPLHFVFGRVYDAVAFAQGELAKVDGGEGGFQQLQSVKDIHAQ